MFVAFGLLAVFNSSKAALDEVKQRFVATRRVKVLNDVNILLRGWNTNKDLHSRLLGLLYFQKIEKTRIDLSG